MGRRSAGRARPEQFRHACASNIIATATSRFEGFTGKSYLFREEFTSRIWATRYDFPAIKDGRVKREVLPDDTPSGAQGWFINTRRDEIQESELREALIYAFDFEWTNKNIMYGSYRAHPFGVPELRHDGERQARAEELALLEPFRGKVPDEVFGEPFVPPVSDGSGQDRALLRRAAQLLQEAGYAIKDGKRVTPQGERSDDRIPDRRAVVPAAPHAVHQEPGDARHRRQLRIVDAGADAAARATISISTSSIQRFGFSATPGDSLRTYFSSQAAALKGSQNLAGIADPAIDALIDKIIAAKTRAELTTACRALDRRDPRRAATGFRTGTRRRTGSPIGMCSAGPPTQAALCPRRAGNLVVRSRQGGQDRAAG